MLRNMSIVLSKKDTQNLSGWDKAISDAEKAAKEARRKAAELKRTIQTFKEFRDSGVPFPGETKTDVAQ
jgi:predicted translin family RNA/ssDNA-binding protein